MPMLTLRKKSNFGPGHQLAWYRLAGPDLGEESRELVGLRLCDDVKRVVVALGTSDTNTEKPLGRQLAGIDRVSILK
jgi:hypothetical protein